MRIAEKQQTDYKSRSNPWNGTYLLSPYYKYDFYF